MADTQSYVIIKDYEPVGSYKASLAPLTYPDSYKKTGESLGMIIERRDLTLKEAEEVGRREHIRTIELDIPVERDHVTQQRSHHHHKLGHVHRARWRGQEQRIAILDSGLDQAHAQRLGSVVHAAQTFLTDGLSWYDDDYHGTWCACATLEGAQGVPEWVTGGVSRPEVVSGTPAKLIVARVFGRTDAGSMSGVIDAVNWVVSQGATVISASFSFSMSSPFNSINQVFDAAVDAGVTCVTSAGNAQVGTDLFTADSRAPNTTEKVISVANTTITDSLRDSSSWGRSVKIAALGTNVLGWGLGGSVTKSATGTSMSAPAVAGVAAALRSQGATHDRVRDALLAGARNIGLESHKVGSGVVDAKTSYLKLTNPNTGIYGIDRNRIFFRAPNSWVSQVGGKLVFSADAPVIQSGGKLIIS